MHTRLWAAALLLVPPAAGAAEDGWVALLDKGAERAAWKTPAKEWVVGGDAALDAKSPRMLAAQKGEGVLVNCPPGHVRDLVTSDAYQDLAVHVEFMLGKGSNSGVKLMGLYEVQLLDSFGKKELTGDTCGGIYPRAEDKPRYHHIDKGTPPRTNAAKKPGEWQTLDVVFRAPRFDERGKKVEHARFVKVVLNGQVVHENVEVPYPTGAAWRLRKEVDRGPLLLQADHGPVAFRNVRVRPLAGENK